MEDSRKLSIPMYTGKTSLITSFVGSEMVAYERAILRPRHMQSLFCINSTTLH